MASAGLIAVLGCALAFTGGVAIVAIHTAIRYRVEADQLAARLAYYQALIGERSTLRATRPTPAPRALRAEVVAALVTDARCDTVRLP